MIWRERKLKQRYRYSTNGIWGSLHIWCEDKIKPDMLDDIFTTVFGLNLNAGTITGEVVDNNSELKINYKFLRKKQWL